MSDKTEKKIIDAALNVFSERGYAGATTLFIAEKSGFSEKTLFRKFKTKENLFNMAILQKGMEMAKFFEESVMVEREFENNREFLETLIKNFRELGDQHFEFFHVSITERTRIHEPIQTEFNFRLSGYLKKHIPDLKIDYMTLGLTISAFLYMTITEYNLGHQAIDLDTVLEEFVDILLLAIES